MSLKIMKVYFNDYDLKFIFMKCKGIMMNPYVVFYNGAKCFLNEEGMFKNITRADIENTPCAKVSITNKKPLNFHLLPKYADTVLRKCQEKDIPFQMMVRYIYYVFYKDNDNEYFLKNKNVFDSDYTLNKPKKAESDPIYIMS